MRAAMLAGKHHVHRQQPDLAADAAFTQGMADDDLPAAERAARRLAYVMDREQPVILEHQRIVGIRTVVTVPEIFTDAERAGRAATHRIHELGKVSNVTPDYAGVLRTGLLQPHEMASGLFAEPQPSASHGMRNSVIESIDAVLRWTDRYAEEAARAGSSEQGESLSCVIRTGARTFAEALQLLRIVHYALWCSFNYHNTFGRFDQYLWPYLEADLAAGVLDREDALELVEEFFIACNLDSDLYSGVQQGDNGQSVVLGGVDRAGRATWNVLTELCLQASLELELIDPKINLRVSASTPLDQFVSGTRLTAKGLGFPQYSNDDIVIPGLVALGYDQGDARDYVVAACWEFIIPGVGMDVPNIAALSFPAAVDRAVRNALADSQTFDSFMVAVRTSVTEQAQELAAGTARLVMEPAPLLSALMPGCIERGRDASEGLRYNNYGIHGVGLSTAADSLAAIRAVVFDEGAVSPRVLIEALDDDFVGHDGLRAHLRDDAPKMGNDDDTVDEIAADLLNTFADALAGLHNDRGGVFRAGTGSAMFYITHAATLGATADGRRAGEFLSANLAPSLGVKVAGPLSVLHSFAKLPLGRAINGGPVTIELHSTVFRGGASIEKVAMLVRSFMQSGGHQLQLNALDRATLLDAQDHPERHRNLIVRVWGWSAYFVELDKQYQDQILQRVELMA
jgi:formate C-acetyltransferase